MKDEWISVKERLPGELEFVLAYGNEINMKMQVVSLWKSGHPDRVIGYQLNGNSINDVTHWMPLPSPPNQGH